jgi:SAM-dependent methyltransferase
MKNKTAFADDTRNRYIQLGCGQHPLPSPWENYDREVNIERPLPFPNESVRFLFAEHLIEHVPITAGLAFLDDCHRVLEPGGVLRLAFPDVTRFFPEHFEDEGRAESRVARYCHFLSDHGVPNASLRDVLRHITHGSGHRAIWSLSTAWAALVGAGFAPKECLYGDSDVPALRLIERHHFSVPEFVAIAETTILEATK